MPVENEALSLAGMIQNDDAEANGGYALMMEIRRTVARIRFCDRKIIELSRSQGEGALVWGVTSEVDKDGYDKEGPVSVHTVTKESKVSAWVELQFKERNHLKELSKIWISAGFEQRKLDLQASTVAGLNQVIEDVIRGLGRSPDDANVRSVVQRALRRLQATAKGIDGKVKK